MNDHFLEMNYKGWSNQALQDRVVDIILFDGSKIELDMLEREIKRRKEAEDVA